MNVFVQVFSFHFNVFSFLLGKFSRGELLGHRV